MSGGYYEYAAWISVILGILRVISENYKLAIMYAVIGLIAGLLAIAKAIKENKK